ncbi:hypothetical protein CY34DRAFT_109651 [Suillus luteus UH-Slu-Lm8-n1]|uniref:Unplaced genomic scaffold CY34scaffold_426, whole genome shotgun sequence n=1 Tax=Suillus luteus UH-Slu-Lm8-n1 TaxID=930992 RepID=A0A0D0ADC1_9AGAM|nr:hypothetical protein CY34DRAFT_109651 [Suillus luteus UH-Slu-Lm8-n1]
MTQVRLRSSTFRADKVWSSSVRYEDSCGLYLYWANGKSKVDEMGTLLEAERTLIQDEHTSTSGQFVRGLINRNPGLLAPSRVLCFAICEHRILERSWDNSLTGIIPSAKLTSHSINRTPEHRGEEKG